MDLKGSQTEKNLKAAFSGESMARNKYLFFAEQAAKENHPEIKELFERMAVNEGIHGKLLYKTLINGIKDSTSNLKDSMEGEYSEWSSMYPEFAKKAEEEGFDEIATLFKNISKIEKEHEAQFLLALTSLMKKQTSGKSGTDAFDTPQKELVAGYRCMFCGATYTTRPDVCGVCEAIGSFEPAQIIKKSDPAR